MDRTEQPSPSELHRRAALAVVTCIAAACAGAPDGATATVDTPDLHVTDAGAEAAADAAVDTDDAAAVDAHHADATAADASACPVAGAACDDGDPCTIGDRCQSGACAAGLPVCACKQDAECADVDLCATKRLCDTAVFPYRCRAQPGSAVLCDPSLDTACARNVCNPNKGTCALRPTPAGTPCQDGDLCTVEDACSGGSCLGAPKGVCVCQKDADCAPLDDGNPCTGTLYCDTVSPYGACKVNPATVVV